MKSYLLKWVWMLCLLLSGSSLWSQQNLQDHRLDWFNQAKFGMFIHWGIYAIPAGEWKGATDYAEWIMLEGNISSAEYEKFAGQFNPTSFDAKAWVSLARAAGMNYIVITCKHHDGFCMYDSKFTDYDIMDATPFKRDIIKELSDECKKAGITFCVYYSLVDWHHPEFPQRYSQLRREFPDGFHGQPNPDADIKKYVTYMRDQVHELLTHYGDIGIVWFDGGGSFRNRDRRELLDGQALVEMIHTTQPNCLINNRLGFAADYGTPEQEIPESSLGTAFEVCMTLNRHWGFNKNDHDWKSAETVIQNLCDIASKGGNYLLNVGPTAEGVIPAPSVKILKKVGQWLQVNGEAIYNTQAGPGDDNIRLNTNGRMTIKPGKLYLHIFHWPENQTIFLEGMKGHLVKKVYLLSDPSQAPLDIQTHERCVFIKVPKEAPDPYASVVVVEYRQDEPLQEFYR